MTCIVAIKDKKKVYMGSDACCVSGYDAISTLEKKIFIKNGKFLMGTTGSVRFGQILRYSFDIPKQYCKDDHEYLCNKFAEALRRHVKEAGYSKIKDNQESTEDTILLGYKGGIYNIDPDFSVINTKRQYNAIGCGQNFALGSLSTTAKANISPEIRILEALKTASKFSIGVYPPYTVLSI